MNEVQSIQDILVKLSEFLVSQAPVAWEYLMMIERISSISYILICTVAFLVSSYGLHNLWTNVEKRNISNRDLEVPYFLAMIGFGFMVFVAAVHLLDVWEWVGMFRPDLKIIRDLYEAVKV